MAGCSCLLEGCRRHSHHLTVHELRALHMFVQASSIVYLLPKFQAWQAVRTSQNGHFLRVLLQVDQRLQRELQEVPPAAELPWERPGSR
jgi:hypothetical protein